MENHFQTALIPSEGICTASLLPNGAQCRCGADSHSNEHCARTMAGVSWGHVGSEVTFDPDAGPFPCFLTCNQRGCTSQKMLYALYGKKISRLSEAPALMFVAVPIGSQCELKFPLDWWTLFLFLFVYFFHFCPLEANKPENLTSKCKISSNSLYPKDLYGLDCFPSLVHYCICSLLNRTLKLLRTKHWAGHGGQAYSTCVRWRVDERKCKVLWPDV